MTIFGSHRSDRTARSPGVGRRAVVGVIALLPVLAALGTVAPAGAGTRDVTPKVTLCHATNSDTNPYREITVDSSSVTRTKGHQVHSGPVWNPTLKDQKISWGDIIPAFTWIDKHGVTQHYGGMNTDALNVLANGCTIPTTPVTVTVTPIAPTVVPSTVCDVQGHYTITATKGVAYLLNGAAIAAGTYPGPASGTVTARAATGYTLSNPAWTFTLNVPAAAVCPKTTIVTVTPVNPTVAQSTTCEVQGTYTIPSTTGITYLLDGKAMTAGTHDGPAAGSVTAKAKAGYTLSTTTWSYTLTVQPAEICAVEAPTSTTPTSTTETTSALPKTGSVSPALAGAGALALLLGVALLAVGSRRPKRTS